MKKACNVSNKCVTLPKILSVFVYSLIQTYIYLYSIYNSNQQVNKESLSKTSRHSQQKSCQLKKLKENNRFSIATKYYFYILLNIITANSSQQFTADQSIGLQRHTNEIKSFHREDCILLWPCEKLLLDGKRFFLLVLIENKLGCNLNPRRGSFSVPVTNLSILPRSTLPLLPPLMNIKKSVHNGFHKFKNH